MANINKNANYSGIPGGWRRGGAYPLDPTEVFYSLVDAQNYAQTDVTSYVGQRISVVSEAENSAQLYVIANTAGELQEVGSGSGSAMIFVNTIAALKTLGTPPTGVPDDLSVGQQAFVTEDQKIHFLTSIGTPGDPTTYNWEVQSSDAPVWNDTSKPVTFYVTNESGYASATPASKPDTLFFLNDTLRICKGNLDVTSSVIVTNTIPEVATAIKNKLYINPTTLEVKITTDGTSFVSVSPGYLTDGANWASADSTKFATIGLIKKGIQEALAGISTNASFDAAQGTITVGAGTPATLTGVAYSPSYSEGTRILTIKSYGSSDVVVTIPDFADKFVTAGKFYAQYPEEEPEYYNVIVLTIENQVEPVIIPAEALVNVYTADNTGNDITVEITADNKISASVLIDPASGSVLTTSASGLKVDVSGKMDKIADATGSKVALTDSSGNVVESTYTVISGETPLGTSDTQLATAKVIAAAIATAQNTLQSAIDGKLNKLTGSAGDAGKIVVVDSTGTAIEIGTVKIADLATKTELANKVDKVVGTSGNLVAFGAEGAIADSGKSVGTTTLTTDATGNVIATEAAVNNALAWKTLE